MKVYMATIQLMCAVDNEAEMGDAVSAILTEQMRKYVGDDSCLIDWQYVGGNPLDAPVTLELPADYEPDESPFPVVPVDTIATLKNMHAFASLMMEKHGANGDDTMTDAEHALWQDASGAAVHILGRYPAA